MVSYHQIFIFTFALVLQGTTAYVTPLHIKYSEEQLRALEANPRPIRFDIPRELIENQYGAKIYYDEILPHENEVISKTDATQNESPLMNFRQGEYNLNNDNDHKDILKHNCDNPYTCNIQTSLTPPLQTEPGSQGTPPSLQPPLQERYPPFYNWNHPNNVRENYHPIDDVNYDYFLFINQYQDYLRGLLFDFHRQRQIFMELITQQEIQLQQLRAQYNQLNNAIANTEFEMFNVQSGGNHQHNVPVDTNTEMGITEPMIPSTTVGVDDVEKSTESTIVDEKSPIEN